MVRYGSWRLGLKKEMNSRPNPDKVAFSGRQNYVADTLRLDIVSGVFKPGGRMPSHVELVNRFGVSGVTIQHALNQLIRDGFLYSLPRKGTFVVPDPPHLCHYAMTFHTQPSQPSWPQFWIALSREAIALQQAGSRQLSMFHGIHGWSPGSDYEKLTALVSRHLVAGLIFTSDPHSLVGSPLMAEPGIPRVAITPNTSYEGVTAIELDSLAVRISAALPRGQRRNVAVLTTPTYPNETLKSLLCKSAEDVLMRPEWVLAVRVEDAVWARNAAQSLMSADRRRRPNVVIITDDNLVPHATAGIAAAGVRVPEDVDVIAHATFPWPTPSWVPARRIGHDVRRVLGACMDIIDAKHAGRDVPRSLTIPAVFEEELGGSQASDAAGDELQASAEE